MRRKSGALRRVLTAFCAALLSLALFGCAPRIEEPGEPGGMTIVTTNFPLFDFARTVAGGRCRVIQMLPPGADSHAYEPSAQDIVQIQECDLFLYIGGESDEWIRSMLESLGEQAPPSLALIDHVQTLEEEERQGMTIPGEGHGEQEAAHEREPDEHIWTSLRNAQEMVNVICEEMCSLDVKAQEIYRANAAAYTGQLAELDSQFAEMTGQALRNCIVMGDRFPFLYFAQDYGLDWYAAFPGCSAQTEPSAATIAFLTDLIERENLPAVLYIESSNHKVADAIAEAAGTPTALLHSCHNLTSEQVQSGETYLSLMEQNYRTLKEVLNGHAPD